MSKESHVKFETAKLLKDKGFDWKVFHFYDGDGHLMHREGDCYSLYNWNYPTKDEYASQYCSAPTQQMACRWLREEHGLFIEIMCGEDGGNVWYDYDILPVGKDAPIIPESDGLITYNEPEEAIEAALQYCLTNLI